MKKMIFTLWMAIAGVSTFAQQVWSDRSRVLPDQLRNIPTGIIMYHTPSPVWPTLNADTAAYPGRFVWKHSTSAYSMVGNLKVVSAGSYIWLASKGWQANMRLDTADFAKFFACTNAHMRSKKTYTFGKNYRYGDALYGGDALWYILAKDKRGTLYKGVAVVETEAKLNTAK